MFLLLLLFLGPCPPKNLSPSVNCNTRVISLSWDASNGTQLYTVSAEGSSNKTELSTNDTTAHFSGLTCGQNYSLAVAPRSQRCAAAAASASAQAFIPSCRLHTSAGLKKTEISPNTSLIKFVSQGHVHLRESPPCKTVSLPSLWSRGRQAAVVWTTTTQPPCRPTPVSQTCVCQTPTSAASPA